MEKQTRRGYVPTDEKEFGKDLGMLRTAAEEVSFLLDRGYPVKSATTFVGNRHLLSERQRLALARALSPRAQVALRRRKQLSEADMRGKTLHIDGFNTVITLEIACSGSTLLRCMDGTVRDLAGMHGTYRLIDKTDRAILLLRETLTSLQIERAVFLIDRPVSNSGRLAARLTELLDGAPFAVGTACENAVDHILKGCGCIATAGAIILDECVGGWFDLTGTVLRTALPDYPYVDFLPADT